MPFLPPEIVRSLQTLVVDADHTDTAVLCGLLEQHHPDIHIIGRFHKENDAITAVTTLHPQLVFVDISTFAEGGRKLLEFCDSAQVGVIIMTTNGQYAVEAINQAQLFGYLSKPLNEKALNKAIQRVMRHFEIKKMLSFQHARQQAIIVQDARKGALVIPVKEILYCKAEGSFTDILRLGKDQKVEKITFSGNLRAVEDRLPQLIFCRVHHSYLLNLDAVQRVERTGRNGCVHLKNTEVTVPVSVAKMDCFQARLEQFYTTHGWDK